MFQWTKPSVYQSARKVIVHETLHTGFLPEGLRGSLEDLT